MVKIGPVDTESFAHSKNKIKKMIQKEEITEGKSGLNKRLNKIQLV